MTTPLTVATGLVLVAGVVIGVTTTQDATADAPDVQPIRVEAPQVPGPAAAAGRRRHGPGSSAGSCFWCTSRWASSRS